MAKKTVKTRLVFEKLVEVENIKVTDEDIVNKYNITSEKPKTIDEIKKELGEDQYNYMANNMLINKLLKFLKENNNI